jgi:hypothetical protein
MEMRVNMLRLRLTIDAHPRRKNGQPPHKTTGDAMASSNHPSKEPFRSSWIGWRGMKSETMMASRGNVRAALIQNRRVMLLSSGFASMPVTVIGSSVIPQIGQFPGSSRMI